MEEEVADQQSHGPAVAEESVGEHHAGSQRHSAALQQRQVRYSGPGFSPGADLSEFRADRG